MRCHEVDYTIIGHDIQMVEVELDPKETVIAEAGAMTYLEQDIAFEAKMGDGSRPSKPLILFDRHRLNSMPYNFLKCKISKETGFLTPLYFTTGPIINSLAKKREREIPIINNQNGILFSRLEDSK